MVQEDGQGGDPLFSHSLFILEQTMVGGSSRDQRSYPKRWARWGRMIISNEGQSALSSIKEKEKRRKEKEKGEKKS